MQLQPRVHRHPGQARSSESSGSLRTKQTFSKFVRRVAVRHCTTSAVYGIPRSARSYCKWLVPIKYRCALFFKILEPSEEAPCLTVIVVADRISLDDARAWRIACQCVKDSLTVMSKFAFYWYVRAEIPMRATPQAIGMADSSRNNAAYKFRCTHLSPYISVSHKKHSIR